MDELEVARITITRTLSDDGDLCYFEFEGDAEVAVVALGMLELARDTVLHPCDDDHE